MTAERLASGCTIAPAPPAAPLGRRLVSGLLGAVLVAAGAVGLRDPLASMASYSAALMVLNQAAPPLLLLALPRLPSHWLIDPLLDPWLAFVTFAGLSVAVSLPGLFESTLANALYAAPLGAFELASGLLFWAQLAPATRRLRPWWAALFAWAGSVPMTVVAVIWMLSPRVLYTPYLNVVCRWDVPPLLDQKWAGLVMFVAGFPLQLAGTWMLLYPPEPPPAGLPRQPKCQRWLRRTGFP